MCFLSAEWTHSTTGRGFCVIIYEKKRKIILPIKIVIRLKNDISILYLFYFLNILLFIVIDYLFNVLFFYIVTMVELIQASGHPTWRAKLMCRLHVVERTDKQKNICKLCYLILAEPRNVTRDIDIAFMINSSEATVKHTKIHKLPKILSSG